MNSAFQLYNHPAECDYADDLTITVNGHPLQVLHTKVADFALFAFDPTIGPVEIKVTMGNSQVISKASLHPIRVAPALALDGPSLTFTLAEPLKFYLQINARRRIFLWANPPVTAPAKDTPGLHFFETGKIHDVGELVLKSGDTLFIEGGAVVRGSIRARNAENITICGHGIFDGGHDYNAERKHNKCILFEHCNNITVSDITMIHPQGWMLVPAGCENVRIHNLKQIGEVMGSDGIDIVGCRHVHITDCFLHNNDDCVVVKAFVMGRNNPALQQIDCQIDVSDVLVENCTFDNYHAGNAIEIGHELTTERISNITYRNIDIIGVHGCGAAFSIHNYDRSVVEDILFEDIRVEHCYDKFIDFRISKSRYSHDTERGQIRNITLRNIQWTHTVFNAGYTTSTIGGWDENHIVSGILLENISINGRRISDIKELDIFTRFADNIRLI